MQTNRASLAALATVLLVLAAGCLSGVPFADSADAPTTAGPASGDRTDDRAPLDGAAPSTQAVAGDVPAYAQDGSAVNASLVDVHLSSLSDADSFTTHQRLTYEAANGTRVDSAATTLIDRGQARALQHENNTVGGFAFLDSTAVVNRTTYHDRAAGVAYQRQSDSVSGNTSYAVSEDPSADGEVEPVSADAAMRRPILRDLLGNVSYEQAGVVSYRGQNVTKFVANDTGAFDGVPTTEGETITAARSTVLVSADGTIRYVGYHVEYTRGGEPGTFDYAAATTAVGNTTVDEPGWTSQAS